MRQLLTRLFRSQRGASLAEYCILIALIAVVCVAAVTILGTAIRDQLFVPAGNI